MMLFTGFAIGFSAAMAISKQREINGIREFSDSFKEEISAIKQEYLKDIERLRTLEKKYKNN